MKKFIMVLIMAVTVACGAFAQKTIEDGKWETWNVYDEVHSKNLERCTYEYVVVDLAQFNSEGYHGFFAELDPETDTHLYWYVMGLADADGGHPLVLSSFDCEDHVDHVDYYVMEDGKIYYLYYVMVK